MFRSDYKKPDDINFTDGYTLSKRVQEGGFFSTRPQFNYYTLAAEAKFKGPRDPSAGPAIGAPAAVVDQYLLDPQHQQRVAYCSDFDVQTYDAIGNIKYTLPLELYPAENQRVPHDGKGRLGTPVNMPLPQQAYDDRFASPKNCYYAPSDYP